MSLDAAEIDLRNAFTYGQGYVALSRVRTLAGMKVLGLNNNALTVNPKIVAMDEKFRAESDDAEAVFKEMEEKDISRMHENFVKACGGKMPVEGAEKKERNKYERIKKESTLEVTKELVKRGLSVKDITRERQMALSTIWGHVEKLAGEKSLTRDELLRLSEGIDDWDAIYADLREHMIEVGTGKLKPIFEAAGEKYDYDVIRLARIMYTL
jgi:hypothetical protein